MVATPAGDEIVPEEAIDDPPRCAEVEPTGRTPDGHQHRWRLASDGG